MTLEQISNNDAWGEAFRWAIVDGTAKQIHLADIANIITAWEIPLSEKQILILGVFELNTGNFMYLRGMANQVDANVFETWSFATVSDKLEESLKNTILKLGRDLSRLETKDDE